MNCLNIPFVQTDFPDRFWTEDLEEVNHPARLSSHDT